jgi:hypothetical protein
MPNKRRLLYWLGRLGLLLGVALTFTGLGSDSYDYFVAGLVVAIASLSLLYVHCRGTASGVLVARNSE